MNINEQAQKNPKNEIPLYIQEIANIEKEIRKNIYEETVLIEMKSLLGDIDKYKKLSERVEQFTNPDVIKAIKEGIDIHNGTEKYKRKQYEIMQDIKRKWIILEEELQTKNRYFPNSDLLSIFDSVSNIFKYIFPENSVFYRARKINQEDLSDEVNSIINIVTKNFNDFDYQKQSNKDEDMWDYLFFINQKEWERDFLKEIKSTNINFWGFNAEKSDAPPPNDIQGRANPAGINYLYGSRNISTAISEIQPTISQLVSVADIKTSRDLNIFNFDFEEAFNNLGFSEKSLPEIEEKLGMSFEYIKVFFDTISELFSKPVLGETKYYYTTQYISEYIKNKGYDGIMFKSSLRRGGINIVLFDTSRDDNGNHKNYQITNSYLHKVDNVIVVSKNILPKEELAEIKKYRLENMSRQNT